MISNGNTQNGELFSLFDQMINGHLQPHLLDDENCTEIKKTFLYLEEYEDEWTTYEIVYEGDSPEDFPLRPKSSEKLAELLKKVPAPPTQKGLLYLLKIGKECSMIKNSVEQFIKESDPGSYENYSRKQITILRVLAEQLRKYIISLGGEQIRLFDCSTNHFICFVLKFFIVDLIRFMQRIFDMEITPEDKLRMNLFDEKAEHIELERIIPFVNECCDEKEGERYLSVALELIRITMTNGQYTVGEALYRFYETKYGSLEPEKRMDSFREELKLWQEYVEINNRIATDFGENFNHPDIEKVLIPLLSDEVNRSESEEPPQSTTGKGRTFNTGLTPAALDQIRVKLIKRMTKDITMADFEYLFTGKPLKNKMKKLQWLASRPIAHEFLRRVVYGEGQFDFRQVNECMQFRDGKLLDSNCKSRAEYKNDDFFGDWLKDEKV